MTRPNFQTYDVEVVDTVTLKVVSLTGHLSRGFAVPTGEVSREGTRAVLAHNLGGQPMSIWLTTINGTVIRSLVSGPVMPSTKSPLLDRQARICGYEESTQSNRADVFTVKSDGTSRTNLTSDIISTFNLLACVSPNGDRVFWASNTLGYLRFEWFWAHPDGTRRTVIKGLPKHRTGGLVVNEQGTMGLISSAANPLATNPEQNYEIFLWCDTLSASGVPYPGSTLPLLIEDATQAGAVYVARCSFSCSPGIPVPGAGTVPLTPDALFYLSGGAPSIFKNFTGVLDSAGSGMYSIAIPRHPGIQGIAFYTSFIAIKNAVKTYPPVKIVVR